MRGLLRKWLILGVAFLVLLPPPVPAHPDTGESKSLSIVHLGDSYSAGNGIGNHHGPAPGDGDDVLLGAEKAQHSALESLAHNDLSGR